ncbi:hypothetical protein MRX96_024796 [Rhipicephalus microplus]
MWLSWTKRHAQQHLQCLLLLMTSLGTGIRIAKMREVVAMPQHLLCSIRGTPIWPSDNPKRHRVVVVTKQVMSEMLLLATGGLHVRHIQTVQPVLRGAVRTTYRYASEMHPGMLLIRNVIENSTGQLQEDPWNNFGCSETDTANDMPPL